jgi:type VI secretion system protein ImpE
MSATAEDLLKEGRIEEAMQALQDKIRKSPGDGKLRVFLFQLLVVQGAWERALTQLQVNNELDPATLPMVQTYRELIQCEVFRRDVFAGRRSPLLFGEPAQWMARMVQALHLHATGETAAAEALWDEAYAEAPATGGTVDGQPFTWIADADNRLGPLLEAIVNGQYYWIPFAKIRGITVDPPADLRDMVWTPVHFTWSNGGETVGFLPTRYAGSEAAADPLLRLSRKTEWGELVGEYYQGLGQRMFATDEGDHPLLEIREIALDSEPVACPEPEGEPGAEGEPVPSGDAPAAPAAPAG